MPKLKTHKATAKRFKITGRGKLRRRKQNRDPMYRLRTPGSTAPVQHDDGKTAPCRLRKLGEEDGGTERRSEVSR